MAQLGVWENDVAGARSDPFDNGAADPNAAQQQRAADQAAYQQSVFQTINPLANQNQGLGFSYNGPMSAQGLPLMSQGQWDLIRQAQAAGSGQQGQGQGQNGMGQGSSGPMISGFNPTYQNHDGYNSQQYADLNTANQLSQYFGGQTVQTQIAPGSPFNVPPQNMINMGSGDPFNAGLVADIYSKYPKAVADMIMADQMRSAGVGNNYSMVGGNDQRSAAESQFTNVPGGINAIGNPGGANLLDASKTIGQGQSGWGYTPANGSNTQGVGGRYTPPEVFNNQNLPTSQLLNRNTNPAMSSTNSGASTNPAGLNFLNTTRGTQTQTPATQGPQNLYNGTYTPFGGMGATNQPTYQAQQLQNPLTSSTGNNNLSSIGNMLSALRQMQSQYSRQPSYQRPTLSSGANNRGLYYPTFY